MGVLNGKVALITGAGSGMGRSGALLFAEAGAKVAVVDINDEAGQAVVKDIQTKGGDAHFIHANCAAVSDMQMMVETTARTFGKLDIFWHNAGNVGPGAIETTTEKDFDLTIGIHVKGGFFGAKFAIEEMKKIGGGSMLFTSSLAGLKPSRNSAVYSMAKASLVMLTKNLTVQFAPYHVRVNCICPGAVPTPLWPVFMNRDSDNIDQAKVDAITDQYLQKIPLARLADPDDIARAALFLSSDAASYITGAILPVDGGLSVL